MTSEAVRQTTTLVFEITRYDFFLEFARRSPELWNNCDIVPGPLLLKGYMIHYIPGHVLCASHLAHAEQCCCSTLASLHGCRLLGCNSNPILPGCWRTTSWFGSRREHLLPVCSPTTSISLTSVFQMGHHKCLLLLPRHLSFLHAFWYLQGHCWKWQSSFLNPDTYTEI